MTASTIPFVHQALECIRDNVPPPAPVPSIPHVPELKDLRPLAEELGVDPQRILSLVVEHREDLIKLAGIAAEGARLVGACVADLIGVAKNFLQQAIPVAAELLIPHTFGVALARLAALAHAALTEAVQRIARLLAELHPLVLRLAEIAPTPMDPAPAPMAKAAVSDPPQNPQPREEPTSVQLATGVDKPAADAPAAAGQAAADAALTQLGKPYAWGGTGSHGFDCSGLTQWAYKQAGVDLPRTAAEQAVGTQVTYEDLRPGDLAVWDGHVAMYIGSGQIVEAGDPVQTNPVRTTNMGMRFIGFWRPVT